MEDALRFCTECGMENPTLSPPPSSQQAGGLRSGLGTSESMPSSPVQYSTGGSQANVAQNPLLIFGVIAIVAFLALLVGGASVWLLKSPTGSVGSNTPTINASTQPGPPSETSFTTQPDRRASSLGSYESVESKIINGQSIDARDLSGRSMVELQRLRNAVFARHGRVFETAELQRYFDSCAWYVRRSDYTDQSLTPIDKENVKVIIAAEK